jgi:hypothetical protein
MSQRRFTSAQIASHVKDSKEEPQVFERKILNENLEKEIDSILAEGLDSHYREFKLKKNTKGFRTIHTPSDRLKRLQKILLSRITPCVKLSQFSQGFVKGRNLLTNACTHRLSIKNVSLNSPYHLARCTYVTKRLTEKIAKEFISLNSVISKTEHDKVLVKALQRKTQQSAFRMDLKDAFGSITKSLLRDGLIEIKNQNLVLDTIEQLAKLSNICMYKGSLPVGAPTSPMMLNISLTIMDEYAHKTIKTIAYNRYKEQIKYTRYADDIVISSTGNNASKLVPVMRSVIEHFGLTVNNKKTRIMSHKTGIFVTGINLVNSYTHISVSRRRRDKIRAAIYNAAKLKGDEREKKKLSILGRISHVMSIDLLHGTKLLSYAEKMGLIDVTTKVNNVEASDLTKDYQTRNSQTRHNIFSK